MSKKNNKTCIICGKSYSYCPSCHRDANKPSWSILFDSENCKNIYKICTEYRDGEIDKAIAYEKIKECDLTRLEDIVDITRKQIEDILSYKSTTIKVEKNEKEKKDEKIKKDEKSTKVFSKK